MEKLLSKQIAYLGRLYTETGNRMYIHAWTSLVNCDYRINH